MDQDQLMLGMLAVENHLLSQEDLDNALEELGEDCSESSLYRYLESRNLVAEKDLERLTKAVKILTTRQKEFAFGSMLVRLGFINQSVVDLALLQQQQAIMNRRSPKKIGDMLVETGFLTAHQRDYVLNLQKRKRSIPPPDSSPENEDLELSTGPPCTIVSEKISMEDLPEEFQILLPPVSIMPGLHLRVTEDGMAAYLTKSKEFDRDMPVQDLKDALHRESIVFGILSNDMLEGFIASSGFRTNSFKVAKGSPAKGNQQIQIEYFFPDDIFQPSESDDQGKMDYKEKQKIVHVPKGALLAKKTVPRTEDGKDGFDIYGNILQADTADQISFKAGTGTRLSSDGLKIIADIKGRPKRLLSGEIKVIETYIHEGDVGYKSGHLEYNGDIQVKGGVQSGFCLAGENISAVNAQNARIDAQGTLRMTDGIIETVVHAQGDVFAGFIRNSKVRCMGNVVVTGEIVDSVIICSGTCSIQNGSLISSEVSAKKGVITPIVGTHSTKPCHIQVGKDRFVHEELESHKKQMEQIQERLHKHGEKREDFKTLANKLRDQMIKLAHEQDAFQLKLKDCENQLARLEGTGREEKIQDVEYDISCLKKNIEYIEKKLQRTFIEHEESGQQIMEMDQLIAQSKEESKAIKKEMKLLIQWSMAHPGNPMVRVTDTVHSGTRIQGLETQIILKENIHSVIFTEVKGASGYEIRTQSL